MVVEQENVSFLPGNQNSQLFDKLESLLQVLPRDFGSVPVLRAGDRLTVGTW